MALTYSWVVYGSWMGDQLGLLKNNWEALSETGYYRTDK